MHLEKGSRDKFDEYVCHFDRQDLLMGSRTARLYQVVARLKAEGEMLNSKDIQKIIVPTQSFLKYLEGKKGNDWLDPCNEARMQYVAVLRNAEAATADMSLEDVLRTMENFVSVERLPDDVRWSDNGAYKCTCADCHKYCVCEHTILMALVTNEVEIPVKYILSTLPHRRPDGRPAAGAPAQPKAKRALDYTVQQLGGRFETRLIEAGLGDKLGYEGRNW